MNGYYARVKRRRQMLAEEAVRMEEAAVPSFDWICAPVDGITEAVVAAVPHRHAHPADKPAAEPAIEPADEPAIEPAAGDQGVTGE
jgi:hypothetical protein